MPEKKVSCPCGADCKCDPCNCNTEKSACCSKSMNGYCTPGHHFWIGATFRIILIVLMIVGAYAWGVWNGAGHSRYDRYNRDGYRGDNRHYMMFGAEDTVENDAMREHCQMMPDMVGCEAYISGNTTNTGAHDMMDMSMRDMGQMLEGKTGDNLNKAFLEGMIPHHQGAVEMARYLAGSDKPELVKLGADIITAQTKEIEQMQNWMKEWGYTK